MHITKQQLDKVLKARRKQWAAGLLVLGFAVVGMYFLQASRAATVTVDNPLLSLAPASLDMHKDDIVNMAVNVNGGGTPVGDISTTVTYSSDLELQAVRDVCPAPAFSDPVTDSTVAGKVSITCKGASGAHGQTAIAVLVLQAKQDGVTTALNIAADSSVSSAGSKTPVRGSKIGSQLTVQAPGVNKPRPNVDRSAFRTKPASCATGPAHKPHCRATQLVNADGTTVSPDVASAVTSTPQILHNAYRLPCKPGGTTVQAVCPQPAAFDPQTIAVTAGDGYSGGMSALESDFAKYNQKYGLPACTQANGCLKAIGPTAAGTGGWDVEIALDVEAAHTICQTCKILVSFADPNTGDLAGAVDAAARQSGVAAVSNSWGVTDTNDYSDTDNLFEHPGVAILVGDGDIGVYPVDQNDWPSSIPGIVAVSGTTLLTNSDGSLSTETVWAGSGGGCSTLKNAPAWQTSLPNWSGVGCGSKRSEGDISAVGDPNSGILDYYDGILQLIGGTSLSSPLVAGMYGLAGVPIPSGTYGSQLLYQHASSSNVFDITQGNDCTSITTVHCTSGPGFDMPSGLGAPRGLSVFGGPNVTGGGGKTGDLNNDGKVNIQDLAQLLINFGKTTATGDLNKDGKVNVQDLALLLVNFGK